MNILITIDYEVFLGEKTGTIKNCLIRPMDKLISIADKHNVKLTLFVDAVYLLRLTQLKTDYSQLNEDYDNIRHHLIQLNNNGHDIQLHIHPHWMYSNYDGNNWIVDRTHYKLSDISQKEASQIFNASKTLLEDIVGHSVVAFRAGGFSAQPFTALKEIFLKNNIKIDSSVFSKSNYNSSVQQYDYRNVPNKTYYMFEDDICIENSSGSFIEMPLSTMKLSPFFYWKLVLVRLINNPIHQKWGDGKAVEANKDRIIKRLTQPTWGYATIDEYKSSYLERMFRSYLNKYVENDYFVIIGHPKLITPYSVNQFDYFLNIHGKDNNYLTFQAIITDDN